MFLRWLICIYVAALSCNVATADAPLIALPPAPQLSQLGHNLIVEFEVGGQKSYYVYPEWPYGASGITIGIGYDTGYNSRDNILQDWRDLGILPARRLSLLSGITGVRARDHLSVVQDILIGWEPAINVFDTVDISRTFALCQRTFIGFDDLRPNAQASLVSLVFNRGNGMSGPNRTEMRAIRPLVAKRDYEEMAIQLKHMIRVWRNTDIYNGMARRRNAEAALMLTP